MVTLNSDFIANFNKGRNIHRNLETLNLLYRVSKTLSPEEQKLMIKLKIVLMGSIAEAVMYDFQYKAHSFTREIKGDLTPGQIDLMTRHDDDEFKRLLGKFRGNNILKLKKLDLYDDLETLRLLRNRVHIQNTTNDFEEYEHDAFTEERKVLAERTLEHFLKIMLKEYGRGEAYRYVDDFVLPWEAHL